MPICPQCREELLAGYSAIFDGDESAAMERLCMAFDIYYSDDAYESVIKKPNRPDYSLLSNYLIRISSMKRDNKTYTQAIVDKRTVPEVHQPVIDTNAITDIHTAKINKADIELFGNGWTADELSNMRSFYEKIKKDYKNLTFREEADLITACQTHEYAQRALRDNDTANYVKLNQLYNQIIDQIEERFKKEASSAQQQSSSADVILGNKIKEIEMYTPAEYYKDKSLFKDADSIGQYITRFMLRPLKNLLTGSKDMDDEYHVGK